MWRIGPERCLPPAALALTGRRRAAFLAVVVAGLAGTLGCLTIIPSFAGAAAGLVILILCRCYRDRVREEIRGRLKRCWRRFEWVPGKGFSRLDFEASGLFPEHTVANRAEAEEEGVFHASGIVFAPVSAGLRRLLPGGGLGTFYELGSFFFFRTEVADDQSDFLVLPKPWRRQFGLGSAFRHEDVWKRAPDPLPLHEKLFSGWYAYGSAVSPAMAESLPDMLDFLRQFSSHAGFSVRRGTAWLVVPAAWPVSVFSAARNERTAAEREADCAAALAALERWRILLETSLAGRNPRDVRKSPAADQEWESC